MRDLRGDLIEEEYTISISSGRTHFGKLQVITIFVLLSPIVALLDLICNVLVLPFRFDGSLEVDSDEL